MIFLASVGMDPHLSRLIVLSLIIIVVGFFLYLLKQPSIISYIIVGVLVGPDVFNLIDDEALISSLGSMGLVLLLFFTGMEIQLKDLIANWRTSVLGTLIQVALSVLFMWAIGRYFDWSLNLAVLLGFVISISSTAVLVKILQEGNEIHSKAGQTVIGILIVQDILIAPMLIILSYLGGNAPSRSEMIFQILGGLVLTAIILYLINKKEVRLPFRRIISRDHETQVFVAFVLCFGFSTLAALSGLSSALGAFVAGLLIGATKSTNWVRESLHSFKTIFVALFFVSIGMVIDLDFIFDHTLTIGWGLLSVFVINNLINVIVLRPFLKDWGMSIYCGALLSQIGEFSFILGAAAFATGVIGEYGYQLIISIVVLSLLLSPFWILTTKRVLRKLPIFSPR